VDDSDWQVAKRKSLKKIAKGKRELSKSSYSQNHRTQAVVCTRKEDLVSDGKNTDK